MHSCSPLDWQIRDDLAMWRGVLAAETNRLRLTLPEANCIADVLMGHDPDCGRWILAHRPAVPEGEVSRRRVNRRAVAAG